MGVEACARHFVKDAALRLVEESYVSALPSVKASLKLTRAISLTTKCTSAMAGGAKNAANACPFALQ